MKTYLKFIVTKPQVHFQPMHSWLVVKKRWVSSFYIVSYCYVCIAPDVKSLNVYAACDLL